MTSPPLWGSCGVRYLFFHQVKLSMERNKLIRLNAPPYIEPHWLCFKFTLTGRVCHHQIATQIDMVVSPVSYPHQLKCTAIICTPILFIECDTASTGDTMRPIHSTLCIYFLKSLGKTTFGDVTEDPCGDGHQLFQPRTVDEMRSVMAWRA